MSTITIITSPKKSEWRIEPSVVAAALQERWPEAKIRWTKDPNDSTAFDFEWDTVDYHVVGSFNRDGQSLFTTRATHEDLGELAVWFRRMVPASVPLGVWSDSGYHCDLPPEMTVADFLRDYH